MTEEPTKRCGACEEIKPISEFYYHPSGHYYVGRCRPCFIAQKREWERLNPEANRRIRLAEKHRNADKYRAQVRVWAKSNPAQRCASAAERRAMKLQATPVWADQDEIKAIYKYAKDLELETNTKWHVDHRVPLKSDTVCGLHCEANLIALPAHENVSKGNRWWPDCWEEAA